MRTTGTVAAVLTVVLLAAAPALATKNGNGDLIASFHGGIVPRALPRTEPVPVSISVAGGLESASGDLASLPQLTQISVAINNQGRLFDRDLPVCRPRRIRRGGRASAEANCGGAIIGEGRVVVQVRIPDQLPFLVHSSLLVFNGPREDGRKVILAQAYARKPPGSFILTFAVQKRAGMFGTVLTTTLPPGTRSWAYITHFAMRLHRTYTYRGRRRSYLSASCAAPEGFDEALFPFARATYSFANGEKLSMSESEQCRVRE